MRYVLAAMLVVLISCRNNEQPRPPVTQQTPSLSPADSVAATSPGAFHDQGGSSVAFLPDSQVTYIRNVTYEEQDLSRGNDLTYFMVKQTRDTRRFRESEGVDSRITLEIFDIPGRTLLHRWVTYADEVKFQTNFLQTVKYGCCGAENSCQLSDIWNDRIFLPYNEKYYVIDVPNSGLKLFLGYHSDARDDSTLMHGELILAHEIANPGAQGPFSSIEYRTANRVRFVAKTKDFFNELSWFSPTITLLRNTEKDEIADHLDYQEMHLWSLDFHKTMSGLDVKGVRLVFEDGKPIVIDIPIKNGLLFGDTAAVHTVFLED